jgi:hypothetical protein
MSDAIDEKLREAASRTNWNADLHEEIAWRIDRALGYRELVEAVRALESELSHPIRDHAMVRRCRERLRAALPTDERNGQGA